MKINIILAHDVIMNILSCLPVQSLIKFKSVCKAWHELVEDPYFAEIHTGRQLSSSDDPAAWKISFLVVNRRHDSCGEENQLTKLYKLYIEDLNYDDDVYKSSFYTNPITPLDEISRNTGQYYTNRGIHVIGTCNGLVCLKRSSYTHSSSITINCIVVYNPGTKEYVNIPQHPTKPVNPVWESHHGFGYDPTTREYKIVGIVYRLFDSGRGIFTAMDTEIHVYTLGSGAWRIREAAIQHYRMCYGQYSSILFDGSLYWLCYNTEGSVHIASFDLGDEELRMVPGAPQATQFYSSNFNSKYCYELTSLGGSNLCVIEGVQNHEMNIWVMKKDDAKANGYSWSKDFIIPDDKLLHYPDALLTKGGKLMAVVCSEVDNTRDIYCFDSTKRWAKTLRSSPASIVTNEEKRTYSRWEVVPYTRGIVSLKALGEENVKMAVPPGIVSLKARREEDIKMAVPPTASAGSSWVWSCFNPIQYLFKLLVDPDRNLRWKKKRVGNNIL